MIYINMGGGRLGNQMFRYAFARQLQKKNPSEVIIYNFDEIHRTIYNSGIRNENQLDFFQTIGIERQDAINYSIIQYIFLKIFGRFYPRSGSFMQKDTYERRWIKVLEFFGIYYLSLGYYSFRLKKPWWVKNLIVNGSFECDKYFEGIGNDLKKEFVPKQPLHEYNNELLSIIQNTNSVAVSIRRGDFVDDVKTKNLYFVCDKKYYEKAIELIKQEVDNPTFILFSNDIEWAKKNVHIEGCPCYYESGKDEAWETMCLMSSCKHFVISNSTLHWWAQYLSPNPNKVVIAPSKWYNDDFNSRLYQQNWLLVKV